MSHLYDDDTLLWSQRQAELSRRRAAGEFVDDGELDWPNIAEEIESVGISERRALASAVRIIDAESAEVCSVFSAHSASHPHDCFIDRKHPNPCRKPDHRGV